MLKWTEKRVKEEIKALFEYAKRASLPLLEEFATERGYSSRTIRGWRENNHLSPTTKKELEEAIQFCKDRATTALVKGGLAKQFDKTFAIFALKNIAGWQDVSPAVQIQNEGQRVIIINNSSNNNNENGKRLSLLERIKNNS